MSTPLDTQLVDGYTSGMNVPLVSQAGYAARADRAGTNVEFVGAQELTGGGTWDGISDTILVHGTGVRNILLGNGTRKGQTVLVVDADGTAAGGDTITIAATGSMAGSQTITSDYDSRLYVYVGSGLWVRTAG